MNLAIRSALRGQPTGLALVVILVCSYLSAGASCLGPLPGPHDCEAPPAVQGVIDVKEPAAIESYIVVLKSAPLPARDISAARAARQAVRSTALTLQRAYAFRAVDVMAAVNQFSAQMPRASAEALAKDVRVLFVQRNGAKSIPKPVPPTASRAIAATAPWHLDCVDDPADHDGRWNPAGNGGKGVHVWVNDTGFDPEGDEFAGRAGESFDMTDAGGSNFHWHARAVASIAAGARFGVAPHATVHSCRSLDSQGSGTDADVIECIAKATELCIENGWACVGNMSLGGQPAPALNKALCDSISQGVQWAVAGGNENLSACSYSPSQVKQAVVAGAMNVGHSGSSFSNTGQCLSLYAPGEDVISENGGGAGIGESGPWSGTSAASPVLAGLLALCSEDPALTPAQLKQCVLDRATPGILSGITSDSPNLKATHPKRVNP